jgi:hypothetical protein
VHGCLSAQIIATSLAWLEGWWEEHDDAQCVLDVTSGSKRYQPAELEACGHGWTPEVRWAGALWLRVEPCGYGWSPVATGGALWLRVEPCGYGWSPVATGGALWLRVEPCGRLTWSLLFGLAQSYCPKTHMQGPQTIVWAHGLTDTPGGAICCGLCLVVKDGAERQLKLTG